MRLADDNNSLTSGSPIVDTDIFRLTRDVAGTQTSYKVTAANVATYVVAAMASLAVAASTIELGHASDTTLARIAAGRVSIEGHEIATLDQVQTFTGVKTFTTPVLGVASATSINKVAITAPATSATLTIADGKTLTASNTITFTATDGSTLAIGTGGTLATAAYKATGTSGNTVPLLDGANTWSAIQSVSTASNPQYRIQNTAGGTNEKWVALVASTTGFSIDFANDALSSSASALAITRSATSATVASWASGLTMNLGTLGNFTTTNITPYLKVGGSGSNGATIGGTNEGVWIGSSLAVSSGTSFSTIQGRGGSTWGSNGALYLNPSGSIVWVGGSGSTSGLKIVNGQASTSDPHFWAEISSPKSTLYIDSPGATGGWHGRVAIRSSSSAAALAEIFVVDDAGGGVSTTTSVLRGGFIVGTPTGGNKGTGTVNASGVYDDNTLLTCYVLDAALDGSVSLEKWDEKVPNREYAEQVDADGNVVAEAITEVRIHEPARKFVARLGTEYDPLDIDSYAKHWREKRHLTSMPNEERFVHGAMATGEWVQRLVETAEIFAVHIDKLNQRIKALEAA